MTPNRKGSQHQQKHFQPDDHKHAAHQEQVSHGFGGKPGHPVDDVTKKQNGRNGYPDNAAPNGPRKGQ